MREVVGGRYEIVRSLGSGGMGQVMLARQLGIDRLVVVKRVADRYSGPERRALIEESRLAARLHHPNIVSVLDVLEVDHEPIIVMELCAGVSLREMLAHSPSGLPPELAITIAIDVLRGLGYAHTARGGSHAGIVHRDVKPNNVMVTFAGMSKLIDFGISRWLDARGADPVTVTGTRGYMAPEQQRGEAIDGRADQYAVGVTLCEMLIGDQIAALDPELEAIVGRACAEHVDARYPHCEDMLVALEDYAAARRLVVSATRVERWMTRELAAQRLELELDAERAVPPHSPPEPTETPIRGFVVALDVRNTGAAEDAWLGRVIERMLAGKFRELGDRGLRVDAAGTTRVAIEYRRTETTIRAEARHADAAIAAAAAPTVAQLAGELATGLVAVLGPQLPARQPDADELAAMARAGATSIERYRRFHAALRAYFATNFPDLRGIGDEVRALVAEDPGWAHASALLALLEGNVTDAARATLAAARAHADPARDPSGIQLLEAYERLARNEPAAAYDVLVDVLQRDPRDMHAGSLAVMIAAVIHRSDEAIALTRELHVAYPDLVFGMDLAETTRRAGREAEAERVIREWVAVAPENLVARVELARFEAAGGRIAEAQRHARAALLVHGETATVLPELFEALVAGDQLADAHRIADRMLVGSALARARGRLRLAMLSVFEGRFAAAYDSIRRAIDEHRAFGMQSELAQCLELARTIAPLVADLAATRRFTADLADVFATVVGDPVGTAATRYELALLGPGRTPAIDDFLADVVDGPQRDVARRRMLRAAALADCGSPHKAVAAGNSAFEDNTASLIALGLCAWRIRELDLARRCFERATRLWSSVLSNQCSPYHAVIARYHLAGVLVELGDRAGARVWYEAFLRCWADPDRPIAEVAVARQMLAVIHTPRGRY